MQTLFTIEPEKKERCKNCIHIYEHQYNQTKYCSQQKQKRTSYGHKKIKANDAACPLFTKKEKE
jgi:hypothetical protein